MESNLIFAAGIIMLLIGVLHTIGGQITLVNPLLDSSLQAQEKVEWLGAWHMITILIFGMALIMVRNGIKIRQSQIAALEFIYYLCILFSISFIAASFYLQKHAPQYILFSPIAILLFFGLKRLKTSL